MSTLKVLCSYGSQNLKISHGNEASMIDDRCTSDAQAENKRNAIGWKAETWRESLSTYAMARV